MSSLITPSENLVDLYMSKYQPAYNNRYTVTIKDNLESSDISSYLQFHAVAISFGEETLSLKRHPVTRNFQLSDSGAYTLSDKLTITWRESDDWKVKKYHEEWIDLFYDKSTDAFKSHDYSKYEDAANSALIRQITVELPSSQKIIFEGVHPSNTGKLDFRCSASPDVVTHSMTYYVRSWRWEESAT